MPKKKKPAAKAAIKPAPSKGAVHPEVTVLDLHGDSGVSVLPAEQPSLEPHGESTIKLPSGTDSQLEVTPAHPETHPGSTHPESPVGEPIVPIAESPTGKDLSDKIEAIEGEAVAEETAIESPAVEAEAPEPAHKPKGKVSVVSAKAAKVVIADGTRRVKLGMITNFHYAEQEGTLMEENEFSGKVRFDDGHEFWIAKTDYK
jgi:hypothetical protein